MNEKMNLPYKPFEFPAVRIGEAVSTGVNKNLAFYVGGGIGDRVAAEPTLRFALDKFKDVEISLICETPELFSHLKFKEIFDLKRTHPIAGRHLVLSTYPNSPLLNSFMNANMVNMVDFISIATLRMQLPKEYKRIKTEPTLVNSVDPWIYKVLESNAVVVHPGKTWPSRTFPADWWNHLITRLLDNNQMPIIIGSSTVDGIIIQDGIIDLRNKTSITELMWICKNAYAVVTNDSSPLHLAVPGKGLIAFIATARRGEMLMYDRYDTWADRLDSKKPEWTHSMYDFATQPMWDKFNLIPNVLNHDSIMEVPKGYKIEDFLPEPMEIVRCLNP